MSKISEVCPAAFKELEGDKAQIYVDLIDSACFKVILTALDNL